MNELQEALQERIRQTAAQVIADRIREARRASDLSHDKLGEQMGGVTRQHLIKLEKGKHRPRAEMLERLAAATGKSVDWFLSPEVDTTTEPFRSAA